MARNFTAEEIVTVKDTAVLVLPTMHATLPLPAINAAVTGRASDT
jgi:hypothetical protein